MKEFLITKDTKPSGEFKHQGTAKQECRGIISIDSSGGTVCPDCNISVLITDEEQEKQPV